MPEARHSARAISAKLRTSFKSIRSGQTERAGPIGEFASRLSFFIDEIVADVIPRVGGENNRDAKARFLGHFLRGIRARGQFAGGEVVAKDQVPDVTLVDVVF